MLLNHWMRDLSAGVRESSMSRVTNATSPPGVIISTAAPVQLEFGGRDFCVAEARIEATEG